ncbi:hypothetical protein KIN20_038286 [Parelaphostrongylus tenuis]|uniref:S1 motif domain-containing protein n=1 Tax=Parelaphostrongylus tenuis TaxID=148309 RepID=A0AAD5RFT2_PARTN|nr:hypothetical protein KIN20_038286 [Parelaphostrongylus tenuis]
MERCAGVLTICEDGPSKYPRLTYRARYTCFALDGLISRIITLRLLQSPRGAQSPILRSPLALCVCCSVKDEYKWIDIGNKFDSFWTNFFSEGLSRDNHRVCGEHNAPLRSKQPMCRALNTLLRDKHQRIREQGFLHCGYARMIAIDHEIDFPRGGTTTADRSSQKKSKLSSKVKSGRSENQLFGVDKKQTTKKRKLVAAETPSKKRKLDGKGTVWKKPITQNLLTDGVMGLGVVVEIYAHYVLLETAYSCRVKLPATQVSKKFTELLKSEEVSLESMFVVGQMVPFRVIERSSLITEKKYRSNGKKFTSENLPVVTCDPTKLNSHITPQTLMPGLVLHAVVVSQEEKGVVMDIGMQSMQAFLPTEKQQRPVQVGQPVIVRVDSLKTSRVVIVNSYVERDNLCLETCESLVLNHLMPGTIIECVPDPQPSVSAGVYVTFGNGVRGFVAKNHLPPRLRSDITKVGKTLRCVVMFCQQNTPLLVLSAHPDVVAISKPEKRASFLGYSIGDRLKCQVIDVVPSKFLVCFSLPTSDDGKVPLIAAISYKQYLKKPEKFETFYSIGSEHKCRIMSFRYADRCIVVSDRKDVFNQKFVSYSDAVLGEVVNAKVTDVHPRGVQVTVNEMIKGFIPLDHVADKKIALEKAFTVGTNVESRVLLVNEKKKQIWLTARPSLVNFKGVLITSYNPNYDGVVTVGTVAKILETGGAVVQFFGAVRGLLPATETRKIADEIRQGMVLNVRVISINASEEKMVLSLADESLCAPKHIINPKSVNFDTNGKLVFTGVVDDVCENELMGGRKSEKILLHLECDTSVKGFLIPIHFSDFLDSPLESMRKSFLKGYKLYPITPLGSVGGINRFTSKRFICTWLECFEKDIPKCFDDLRPRQLVCGVISQRDPDDCLYVEIAGGSGLLGKVAFEDVDGEKDGACSLQVGQTVVGSIRSVHAEKKTFRISLKLVHCVPREHLPSKVSSPAATMALQLVRSCVEEVLEFTRFSKVKLPIHGTAVISTVSQIVDDEVVRAF